MSNKLIVYPSLLAFAFGAWSVICAFQSTPNELSIGDEPDEITYICTETGKISHGDWQPTPALNPATGKKTLMQALYCDKCKKWYRAPPAEMVEQSPRGPTCPVTGNGLTVEGPS